MGPPEKGTIDQLRVMIEGNLTKMTRDAHNIQVYLDKSGGTVMLRIVDGVFVTAKPKISLASGSGAGGIGDGRACGSARGVCTGVGNGVGSGA